MPFLVIYQGEFSSVSPLWAGSDDCGSVSENVGSGAADVGRTPRTGSRNPGRKEPMIAGQSPDEFGPLQLATAVIDRTFLCTAQFWLAGVCERRRLRPARGFPFAGRFLPKLGGIFGCRLFFSQRATIDAKSLCCKWRPLVVGHQSSLLT